LTFFRTLFLISYRLLIKNMFCQKCGTQNPDNGRFCRHCGTDLGNTAALVSAPLQEPDFYYDHKGRKRSNNPHDIRSRAISGIATGIGFFIISMVLLFTGVAGGHAWWWAMLFPAFGSLANGVGQLGRARSVERQQNSLTYNRQTQFVAPPPNAPLPPPAQAPADYGQPRSGSIYDTGEFDPRPPSVTEGTTRHLDINKDNETMTLPNRNDL
jgi:ribosomal protein L40E